VILKDLFMKKTRFFLLGARMAPLLMLVMLAGCSSGLSSVHGKVTFQDGTPLTLGHVMFQPMDKDNVFAPRADIKSADGHFEMSTSKPGDGAPPGKYRVAVQPYSPFPGEKVTPAAAFDPRYSDYETSGLEFEVKPGRNEFNITITKRGETPANK